MGLAFDLQAGYATNPGTTITPLSNRAGDSFAVKSFAPSAAAYLELLLRKSTSAGIIRVRSPLMHDYVQGIRYACPTGGSTCLLADYTAQQLYSQDQLVVEITGASSGTDVGVIGIYYTDLGGASARLAMPGDVFGRVRHVLAIEVDCTASSTIGAWADTLITATQDTLHANTDYAVLGYTLDTAVAAVAIRGTDVSNMRCGGPGVVDANETRDWFVKLSNITGRPHIPIINSANKNATYVSVVDNAASTTTNVSLILAELRAA